MPRFLSTRLVVALATVAMTIALGGAALAAGTSEVDFNRDVSQCAYSATLGQPTAGFLGRRPAMSAWSPAAGFPMVCLSRPPTEPAPLQTSPST
jgi:hypothetical protein